MRVGRLTRARHSFARESADALELDERFGATGDCKSEKDGLVSLLSGEAEERIRNIGGLCTARFAANIVTVGLDYESLVVGTRLKIADAELEIARVGKPCYEACALAQAGETCPLPGSCAFARVLRGGRIELDDEITIADHGETAAYHSDRSELR